MNTVTHSHSHHRHPSLPPATNTSASTHQPALPRCDQCHEPQSRFYCPTCLNERFNSHLEDLDRVGNATYKAALLVREILGEDEGDEDGDNQTKGKKVATELSTHPEIQSKQDQQIGKLIQQGKRDHSSLQEEAEEIQDPFGDPTADVYLQQAQVSPSNQILVVNLADPDYTSRTHCSAIFTQGRQRRATHSSLSSKLHQLNSSLDSTISSNSHLRTQIEKRRELLARRVVNLNKAGRLRSEEVSMESSTEAQPEVEPITPFKKPTRNPFVRAISNHFSLNGLNYYDSQIQEIGEVGLEEEKREIKDRAVVKEGVSVQIQRLKSRQLELEKEDEELKKELARVRTLQVRKVLKIFKISTQASLKLEAESKDRINSSTSIQNAPFVRRPQQLTSQPSQPSKSSLSPFGLSSVSGLPGGYPSSSKPTSPTSSSFFKRSITSSTETKPSDFSPTINSLRLPLPKISSLKDFQKDEINTSLLYCVQSLELIRCYLGMELPFQLNSDRDGRISIGRNWLNPSLTKSKSKENERDRNSNKVLELSLNNSNFNYLSSLNKTEVEEGGNRGVIGNLGASTLNLGASTLSTFESFIQLPGSNHFGWGRASVMGGGADESEVKRPSSVSRASQEPKKEDGKVMATAGTSKRSSESASSSSNSTSNSEISPMKSLNSFITALTMLNYNIFYLAKTQGIQLDYEKLEDLNVLEVLDSISYAPELGIRSHLNLDLKSENQSMIKDFYLEELDLETLSRIYDPSKVERRGSKSKEKERIGGGVDMEESYVDAGRAAESILLAGKKSKEKGKVRERDRRKPEEPKVKERSSKERETTQTSTLSGIDSSTSRRAQIATSSLQPTSAAAAARTSSTANAKLPTNLDFLRSKGQKVAQTTSPPQSTFTSSNLGSKTRSTSQVVEESSSTSSRPKSISQSKPIVKTAEKETRSAGAVIFNGIEIKGKDEINESRKKSSRKKAEKNLEEHDWDVL